MVFPCRHDSFIAYWLPLLSLAYISRFLQKRVNIFLTDAAINGLRIKHTGSSFARKNKSMGSNNVTILFMLLFVVAGCKKSPAENPPSQKAFIYSQDERNLVYGDTAPLSIDMDRDGKADFVLFIELVADLQGDHMYFGINPLRENKVLSGPPDNSRYLNMGFAVAKNIHEPLSNTPLSGLKWTTDHSIFGIRHNNTGNTIFYEGGWYSEVPKYAGILFSKGNKNYLGWIMVKVNLQAMRVSLIDYALEKNGQAEILIGEH